MSAPNTDDDARASRRGQPLAAAHPTPQAREQAEDARILNDANAPTAEDKQPGKDRANATEGAVGIPASEYGAYGLVRGKTGSAIPSERERAVRGTSPKPHRDN